MEMRDKLISYIDFLCQRYNSLSEAKAFNETWDETEYSCKVAKLGEISFNISCLCEIAGVPMPEYKRVTKPKVLRGAERKITSFVFDTGANAQI